MNRDELLKLLGAHLKDRYIPFSGEQPAGRFTTLDESDAIALASVALDFLSERDLIQLG